MTITFYQYNMTTVFAWQNMKLMIKTYLHDLSEYKFCLTKHTLWSLRACTLHPVTYTLNITLILFEKKFQW